MYSFKLIEERDIMLLNSKFHIHIIARMQIKTMIYIQSCYFHVTCVVQMKPINVKIKITYSTIRNKPYSNYRTEMLDVLFFSRISVTIPNNAVQTGSLQLSFLLSSFHNTWGCKTIIFPAKETKNTTFQHGWLRTQTSKGLYLNTLFKDTNFKLAIKKSKCYGS